jgi:serine/threonine protein kinase
VQVSDFGLSRTVQGDDAIQTRTHGTVTHMPPELLMQGTMSKAVDVYSFGVICWEMLMGHRPFSGMTQSQVSRGLVGCEFTVEEIVPIVGTLCLSVYKTLMHGSKDRHDPAFTYSTACQIKCFSIRL